jgi:hypothetical protein
MRAKHITRREIAMAVITEAITNIEKDTEFAIYLLRLLGLGDSRTTLADTFPIKHRDDEKEMTVEEIIELVRSELWQFNFNMLDAVLDEDGDMAMVMVGDKV